MAEPGSAVGAGGDAEKAEPSSPGWLAALELPSEETLTNMARLHGHTAAAEGGEGEEEEEEEEEGEGGENAKESSLVFRRENLPLLGLVLLYSFFAAALISIASPFLPSALESAGVGRPAGTPPAPPGTGGEGEVGGDLLVGLIFAVYPLANLLLAPVCTPLCQRFGRRNVLVFGLLLEATTAATMGLIKPTRANAAWIGYAYLVLRVAQGSGAALSYTALLAFCTDRFGGSGGGLGTLIGFQEGVAGVGYMIGPPFGGLLFALGGGQSKNGFTVPFVVMGAGLLAVLPCIPWALPEGGIPPRRHRNGLGLDDVSVDGAEVLVLDGLDGAEVRKPLLGGGGSSFGGHSLASEPAPLPLQHPPPHLFRVPAPAASGAAGSGVGEAGAGEGGGGVGSEERKVMMDDFLQYPALSFMAVARLPQVMNGALVTLLAGIGFGYITPTLEGHLESFLGAGESVTGALFGLTAATYAMGAPIAGWLADRYGHNRVLTVGIIGMGLAYLLLGPTPLIGSDAAMRRLPLVAAWGIETSSLLLLGAAASLAFIPCMPVMETAASDRFGEESGVGETVAALYNGVYCAGEAAGPLAGSLLTRALGFRWGTTVVAAMLFAYGGAFLAHSAQSHPWLQACMPRRWRGAAAAGGAAGAVGAGAALFGEPLLGEEYEEWDGEEEEDAAVLRHAAHGYGW